MVAAARH